MVSLFCSVFASGPKVDRPLSVVDNQHLARDCNVSSRVVQLPFQIDGDHGICEHYAAAAATGAVAVVVVDDVEDAVACMSLNLNLNLKSREKWTVSHDGMHGSNDGVKSSTTVLLLSFFLSCSSFDFCYQEFTL